MRRNELQTMQFNSNVIKAWMFRSFFLCIIKPCDSQIRFLDLHKINQVFYKICQQFAKVFSESEYKEVSCTRARVAVASYGAALKVSKNKEK